MKPSSYNLVMSAMYNGRKGDRPPVGNPTSIVCHGLMDAAGVSFPDAHLDANAMADLALAGHERAIGLLNRYLGLRRIPQETRCLCLIGLTGSRSLVKAARRAAFSLLRKQGGVLMGKTIGKLWEKNRFRSAYLRNTMNGIRTASGPS